MAQFLDMYIQSCQTSMGGRLLGQGVDKSRPQCRRLQVLKRQRNLP